MIGTTKARSTRRGTVLRAMAAYVSLRTTDNTNGTDTNTSVPFVSSVVKINRNDEMSQLWQHLIVDAVILPLRCISAIEPATFLLRDDCDME